MASLSCRRRPSRRIFIDASTFGTWAAGALDRAAASRPCGLHGPALRQTSLDGARAAQRPWRPRSPWRRWLARAATAPWFWAGLAGGARWPRCFPHAQQQLWWRGQHARHGRRGALAACAAPTARAESPRAGRLPTTRWWPRTTSWSLCGASAAACFGTWQCIRPRATANWPWRKRLVAGLKRSIGRTFAAELPISSATCELPPRYRKRQRMS
mmetsp:Transcript_162921/g.522408  ORF Transcript_162921/g.522408 Transcript_162921/m.522408 type:complete len:213 (+) Transcript_162921:1552-2190(+)